MTETAFWIIDGACGECVACAGPVTVSRSKVAFTCEIAVISRASPSTTINGASSQFDVIETSLISWLPPVTTSGVSCASPEGDASS